MKDLDLTSTTQLLNLIMEYELAGVVRYTHYSLMVTGPNRIPIVQFLKGQANESLLHAQQAGEILTGLGGHPSLKIAPIEESFKHSIYDILLESMNHETQALQLYKDLLEVVENASVYLEEYARGMIGQEEMHSIELRKMLRDFSPEGAAPLVGFGQSHGKEKEKEDKEKNGKHKKKH
ncbi:ferritin-like domain-containing protein [Alkalinema pantanalense CENA528]|uniref:ferritin-like domain-containing protein n=1 Tax=Alkalinema pantanalense TaxID=1620705 RepID=UPI003D6ECEB2